MDFRENQDIEDEVVGICGRLGPELMQDSNPEWNEGSVEEMRDMGLRIRTCRAISWAMWLQYSQLA